MSQATLGQSPYRNSSLFSGYYLDERIDDLEEWECDQQAQDAFEELQRLWELEADLVSGYKEDELLDSWIDEVLEILGFGTQSETTVPGSGGGYNDRLLFDSEETRRDAAKRAMDGDQDAMYGMASAVLEAKQWDADFSKKFDEKRSYRDASHQIKYYLEHTPERLQWGVLTDGKKWRLYGTKDYATEIYYEVDLPELLEAGDVADFKYFYAFFRPEAFREVAGTTFLDTVWNESETAAQELGEDLQDNVFTALRVLGEGFIHTNDLDIDPDDEVARAELKEQSLVLLYRLMFVLYAESRGLIHPEDPDAQTEYEENFSLDQIRLDIHDQITSGDSYDDWSGYATQIWGQLEDLFRLIDEGQESLGIPPYNGGLFDDETHTFLAENEVADRYIAEVIHRLGTTEDEAGDPVPADYADLDTRHLGSIYEGLLEHEFRIASEPYAAVAEDGGQVWKPGTDVSVAEAVETVEEGELYVVNDDGERKATGAYYTPDYVVNYIVEETIDPLLDDIRDELEADGLDPSDQAYFGRFYSGVQDLKILDPAMGSAHFLTSATAYLTEQVMEIVREQERQGRDEQEIRRTIAKECIYGVDINGMAVELGKLSMWLETLAADKPLAFLDHHIKTGNSLVGSDITEVLSDDTEENGGQLTLTQALAHARQRTLEHVMDLMEELLAIDNNNLNDIKSMEELYDEIREDPLYTRLFELANVHTAEEFGCDVPEDAYEEMAGAIEAEDDWAEIRGEDWFTAAQATAEDQDFFHWELEFPEVFFDSEGEKLAGAGFDAVVGNPPWVDIKGLKEPDYLFDLYRTSFNRVNIYSAFIEKSTSLLHINSQFGFITPNSYMTQSSYKRLRSHILQNYNLKSIVRLPDGVFDGVKMETTILVSERDETSPRGQLEALIYPPDSEIEDNIENAPETNKIDTGDWEDSEDQIFDIFTSKEERDLLKTIETTGTVIGDEFESCLGLTPYDKHQGHTEDQIDNRVFHSDERESDEYHRITAGKGIRRYNVSWEGGEWIKYGDHLGSSRERRFFTESRCVVRQIISTDGRGICAAYSDEKLFHTQVGFALLPRKAHSKFAKAIVGILNSKTIAFYHRKKYLDENKEVFQKILIQDIVEFPLPEVYSPDELVTAVEDIQKLVGQRNQLNTEPYDYFSGHEFRNPITESGLVQPPRRQVGQLSGTKSDFHNLRVGDVNIVRESPNTVLVEATARFKPDPDKKGKDAYTETDFLPAFRITDLTEREADLIEHFLPVAVDEAGGFANFRETATKTNSLIDRLKSIELPDVDDVADDLENYLRTKERAEELDEKIEKTDELIDEIVYELYGLTDEEIEIVEEAVSLN